MCSDEETAVVAAGGSYQHPNLKAVSKTKSRYSGDNLLGELLLLISSVFPSVKIQSVCL